MTESMMVGAVAGFLVVVAFLAGILFCEYVNRHGDTHAE